MIYLRFPRYLKVFIVLSWIICGYFLFFYESRKEKIRKIYKLQTSVSKLLQQKLIYMSHMNYRDIDEWIAVNDVNGYILSAYLELRPEVIITNRRPDNNDCLWAQIRIIAILPVNIINNQNIDCVIKLTTKEHSIYQKESASIKALDDNDDDDDDNNNNNNNNNIKYSAAFIVCDLSYPKNLQDELLYIAKELPESVGISTKSSGNLSLVRFIDIYYPKNGLNLDIQKNKPIQSIGICVPALHKDFNRTVELIEFIEYYRLMGVNHMTLYKTNTISHDVWTILQFYKDKNLITVIPWDIPAESKNNNDEGKMIINGLKQSSITASLNDCLYRNAFIYNHEYVGVFDVNEFLVPKYHDDFTELLEYLDPALSDQEDGQYGQYSSFLFNHVYFFTINSDINENNFVHGPYLHTKYTTKRLTKPHSAPEKSRYIIRAQDIIEIGNHRFTELRQGSLQNPNKSFKEMVVEPALALLHHYVPCEAETGCDSESVKIDKTAEKFAKKLSEMVERICTLTFGEKKCPAPSII